MFFPKLCFQSRLSRFLECYFTDLDEILSRSTRYNLQGLGRRIFLSIKTNFIFNAAKCLLNSAFFFVKTAVKRPILIFFAFNLTGILFTSYDPAKSSAANANALTSIVRIIKNLNKIFYRLGLDYMTLKT